MGTEKSGQLYMHVHVHTFGPTSPTIVYCAILLLHKERKSSVAVALACEQNPYSTFLKPAAE